MELRGIKWCSEIWQLESDTCGLVVLEKNISMWGGVSTEQNKKIINKITHGLKWEKKDWRVYYFLSDKINWQKIIGKYLLMERFFSNITLSILPYYSNQL